MQVMTDPPRQGARVRSRVRAGARAHHALRASAGCCAGSTCPGESERQRAAHRARAAGRWREEEGELNAYLKELLRQRERPRAPAAAVRGGDARAAHAVAVGGAADGRGRQREARTGAASSARSGRHSSARFEIAARAGMRPRAAPGVRRRCGASCPGWQPRAARRRRPLRRAARRRTCAAEPVEFSWVRRDAARTSAPWCTPGWRASRRRRRLPAPRQRSQSERAALRAQLARAGVPAREQARAPWLIVSRRCRARSPMSAAAGSSSAEHREAHSELGAQRGERRAAAQRRSSIAASSTSEGTRWVIDYKTSRHEGGGLEEFLAQELERYRAQLETLPRAGARARPRAGARGAVLPAARGVARAAVSSTPGAGAPSHRGSEASRPCGTAAARARPASPGSGGC